MEATTTNTPLGHSYQPEIKDLAGARLLVVDDDPVIHMVAEKILTKANFAYFGANSAIEALEIIHTVKPELILSDVTMPDIDGIEFCTRIRADKALQAIPLIFLTLHSDPETLGNAYEAGATDYVVKPLRPFEVISRVRHHIIEYRLRERDKCKIETLDLKNRSMNKFLGVATHDLRNPLVSIRGISEYLEAQQFGPLNETQSEMVRAIVETSNAMLSLVDDLLSISRFDSKRIQIEPKPESLNRILRMAATLHRVYASDKNIAIDCVDGDVPVVAPVDHKHLTRVIDNLISNAIKFSQPGTTVTLRLSAKDDQAQIAIEDEGPGIPEGEFDKLFKEFSRTSNEPTRGEPSNGLGLYVCKQIVTAHHGDILAENREVRGARFVLTLPLTQELT